MLGGICRMTISITVILLESTTNVGHRRETSEPEHLPSEPEHRPAGPLCILPLARRSRRRCFPLLVVLLCSPLLGLPDLLDPALGVGAPRCCLLLRLFCLPSRLPNSGKSAGSSTVRNVPARVWLSYPELPLLFGFLRRVPSRRHLLHSSNEWSDD